MIKLKNLDSIQLKPFQRVTLLLGDKLKNNILYTDPTIYRDYVVGGNELIDGEQVVFLLHDNNPIVLDISYNIESEHVPLNWDFVKERCKQLGVMHLHEILSDSVTNICIASNMFSKDAFNYKQNLLNTIKYYYDQFDKQPIILRIDSYNGNLFYIYDK